MLLAVFLAGLRHGFDLDHIAAITDISSSQLLRRRALVLGTTYAVGHALVLSALGGIAILFGASIPSGLDALMERLIGVSLVALAFYVLYSSIRFGPEVAMRSRALLMIAAVRRTGAWLRRRPVREIEIEHTHEHPVSGHHHGPTPVASGSHPVGRVVVATHLHPHKHVVVEAPDPFTEYGLGTCFGIGMIHGVGAETPSQILLLTSTAGASGALEGVLLLSIFVVGLLLGNTVLVIATGAGFSAGKRVPRLFIALASTTALISFAVGGAYALGRPDLLPGVLG